MKALLGLGLKYKSLGLHDLSHAQIHGKTGGIRTVAQSNIQYPSKKVSVPFAFVFKTAIHNGNNSGKYNHRMQTL